MVCVLSEMALALDTSVEIRLSNSDNMSLSLLLFGGVGGCVSAGGGYARTKVL